MTQVVAKIDLSSDSKVLSLNSWKNEISKNKEESTLIEYYKLLDFHGLFLEVHAMILDLQNKEICEELALKSKVLLKEFQSRTKSSDSPISGAIQTLTCTLEQNVNRLMAMQ